MFELRLIEIITMLFIGGMAGWVASMAVMVWGSALWLVFGEGRSFSRPDLKPRPTPLKAHTRLLLAMPLVALFHPFPYLIGFIGWFAFEVTRGAVEPQWLWFSISFFGWFVVIGLMFYRMKSSNQRLNAIAPKDGAPH